MGYILQAASPIYSYISSSYLINSAYTCVSVKLGQSKVFWWGPDGVEGALPPQPAVSKLTMEPPTVTAECDAIFGRALTFRPSPTPPVTLHSDRVPRWPRTRREKRAASKCKREVGWKRRRSQSLRRAPGSERGWTRRFKNNRLRAKKLPLGANVSQSVKVATCLLVQVLKCRKCNPRRDGKARTSGRHNQGAPALFVLIFNFHNRLFSSFPLTPDVL